MSFMLAFAFISCDDDNEFQDGIYEDEYGTHLPTIPYDPNYTPPGV